MKPAEATGRNFIAPKLPNDNVASGRRTIDRWSGPENRTCPWDCCFSTRKGWVRQRKFFSQCTTTGFSILQDPRCSHALHRHDQIHHRQPASAFSCCNAPQGRNCASPLGWRAIPAAIPKVKSVKGHECTAQRLADHLCDQGGNRAEFHPTERPLGPRGSWGGLGAVRVWSNNLAPGPLGSAAGGPDRHRGCLICTSSFFPAPAAGGRS